MWRREVGATGFLPQNRRYADGFVGPVCRVPRRQTEEYPMNAGRPHERLWNTDPMRGRCGKFGPSRLNVWQRIENIR